MTNQYRGTLYVGVTNDLVRRVTEHREGIVGGFTKIHGLKRLVYYAEVEEPIEAIVHEKRLKKWRREWKISLIEERNLHWDDLYKGLAQIRDQ